MATANKHSKESHAKSQRASISWMVANVRHLFTARTVQLLKRPEWLKHSQSWLSMCNYCFITINLRLYSWQTNKQNNILAAKQPSCLSVELAGKCKSRGGNSTVNERQEVSLRSYGIKTSSASFEIKIVCKIYGKLCVNYINVLK